MDIVTRFREAHAESAATHRFVEVYAPNLQVTVQSCNGTADELAPSVREAWMLAGIRAARGLRPSHIVARPRPSYQIFTPADEQVETMHRDMLTLARNTGQYILAQFPDGQMIPVHSCDSVEELRAVHARIIASSRVLPSERAWATAVPRLGL